MSTEASAAPDGSVSTSQSLSRRDALGFTECTETEREEGESAAIDQMRLSFITSLALKL